MKSIFTKVYEMMGRMADRRFLLIEQDAVIDPKRASHRHVSFELRFLLDEEEKNVRQIQIVFPGVWHDSLPEEQSKHCYVLSFSVPEIFYRHDLESGTFHSPYQEYLFAVLNSIKEKNRRVSGWQDELYFLLQLVHLRAETFPENLGKAERFEQAVRYLQNFYYVKELSIQDVLHRFGCNPRDAKKFFSSMTGMLPNEYLQSVRMQTAEKLLSEKRYLVKEVAALCGFSDAHYFTNRFKKYFHRSPTGKSAR